MRRRTLELHRWTSELRPAVGTSDHKGNIKNQWNYSEDPAGFVDIRDLVTQLYKGALNELGKH